MVFRQAFQDDVKEASRSYFKCNAFDYLKTHFIMLIGGLKAKLGTKEDEI